MKINSTSVAIVDDHMLFREGISTIINSYPNFEVLLEARNGDDLLVKLSKQEQLPDICIADINMPAMNGYDTCLALKKSYPTIKVIALSVHADNNAIIKMMNCGINGYLHKDVSSDELFTALSIINEEGYFYPKSISKIIFKLLQSNKKEKFDFTSEEVTFLRECCREKTYKEIASAMGVSIRAIEWLRDSLFKKFNVRTRAGLIISAIRIGIIYID